jgi:hypothetical protein
MADNLLYWWLIKLAGKSVDDALSHTGGKYLVLTTRLYLLIGFLTTQMALARFAMGDFTGSGDLKSFSDSFMRLSHDENWEKDDI